MAIISNFEMRISDLFLQFAIPNVNGWPTPAALNYESKPAEKDSLSKYSRCERNLRVVVGHVFKLRPHRLHLSFLPNRHFDPFGTEFSVKPGQANHSLQFTKILRACVATPICLETASTSPSRY